MSEKPPSQEEINKLHEEALVLDKKLQEKIDTGEASNYEEAEKRLFEEYVLLTQEEKRGVSIEVKDISEQMEKEFGEWINDYLKFVEEGDTLWRKQENIERKQWPPINEKLSSEEKSQLDQIQSRLHEIHQKLYGDDYGKQEGILTKERQIKLHQFINDVSGGRYLRFDTLNHQIWGDSSPGSSPLYAPGVELSGKEEWKSNIQGGIYVTDFHNVFFKPEHPLIIFGDKNPRFISYIKDLLKGYLNHVDPEHKNVTPEQKLENLRKKMKELLRPLNNLGRDDYNYRNHYYNILYENAFNELIKNGTDSICVPDPFVPDNLKKDFYHGGTMWPLVCFAILQKEKFFIGCRETGMILPPQGSLESPFDEDEITGKKTSKKIPLSDVAECIVDIRNKKVVFVR